MKSATITFKNLEKKERFLSMFQWGGWIRDPEKVGTQDHSLITSLIKRTPVVTYGAELSSYYPTSFTGQLGYSDFGENRK